MRKFLAATILALLSVSLVTTAVRAADVPDSPDHVIDWQQETPPDGTRINGPDVHITAYARFRDGVLNWDVTLRPETPGVEPRVCHQDIAQTANGRYPTEVYIDCPWDTAKGGRDNNNGLSVNGVYTIEVTVANAGDPVGLTGRRPPRTIYGLFQDASKQQWREVLVDNPVLAPTGVGRSYDSGSRTVTVNWSPNPEPDIDKFIIQEKVGTGSWSKVAERPGGSTNFQKAIDKVGTYQYRVAAVRPEVAQSGWATTDPLEVTTTETTATTSGDPGQAPSDGGDPGVFVPTGAPDPPPPGTAPGPSSSTAQPKAGSGPGPSFGGFPIFSTPSGRSGTVAPRPQNTTTTEFDPGYTDKLPYKAKSPASDGGDSALPGDEVPPQTLPGLPIPRPRDVRALLVPLAGGLATFVFAMQMTFLLKRRPALAPVEDDFDDWLGL
jgi:hypothetical protein